MATRARLAELLAGLSVTADIGYGLPPGEAARACVIGTRLAQELDLPEEEVRAVFYTSLLQHVGCTAYAHETAAAFVDELAMNRAAAKTNFADPRELLRVFLPGVTGGLPGAARARVAIFAIGRGARFGKAFTTATCEVARETARRLGLPPAVQLGLYHVFEWFNGKGAPAGLKADAIPVAARIARVAGIAAFFDALGGPELAVEALRNRSGGLVDSAVAAVFVEHVRELLEELAVGDPHLRHTYATFALRAQPGARHRALHGHRRGDSTRRRARRSRVGRPANAPPRRCPVPARPLSRQGLDTAGDGFLAFFDGPARGIRCGCAIAQTMRELGLELRVGLHTGECELVEGKVVGIAVHIGARIAANAQAGEVLVFSTVKDLVAGSGIEFGGGHGVEPPLSRDALEFVLAPVSPELSLLVEAVDASVGASEVAVGVVHLRDAPNITQELMARGLQFGRCGIDVVDTEAEDDALVQAVGRNQL